MRVCKVLNMLLFAVLIISCTELKTTSQWEPNLQNEAVDSIGYSLFVDSIEYVYLETNDSCLIRSITDMAVSNNHCLYLMSRNKLYGFLIVKANI